MKIALLGDIALIGKYDLTNNANAKNNLETISNYLKSYDYVIGNLETPLTNKKKSLVCKSMHLRSSPVNVELLKFLNISAVSLANNHTYDFGRKGLDDTIKTLKENEIDYFGVDGREIVMEGFKVHGFCCYSTNAVGYSKVNNSKGIHTLRYKDVIKKVESDKLCNRLSILAMHWGDEHTNYPRVDHVNLVNELRKINNIVVNGHHPHVIQGVDISDNSIVAYSQGNFCFDDCKAISGTGMLLKQNDDNRESFILEINIEKNKVIDHKTIGIREVNGEIVLSSVSDKLMSISKDIKDIEDVSAYQEKRKSQFGNEEFRLKKFGKKDFKWYLKRINYYAIGAFLAAKVNSEKYGKDFSTHLK